MNIKTSTPARKQFLTLLATILCTIYQTDAQTQSRHLTQDQARDDFQSLRSALEYVHPRLYKYEDKKKVENRFDSLSNLIRGDISELDFLALVSVTTASVRCGHLYTIPQGELAKVILHKKVLPFHTKVIGDKLHIINDCSKFSIPDGSEIIAINGKSSEAILNTILPGIAADGYIHTRKVRLIERNFYGTFHGFNLYYYVHVDRSEKFLVEYRDYKSKKVRIVSIDGVTLTERRAHELEKYGVDEESWFKDPSPRFEIDKVNDFALLTISRSFHDKFVDPDFDSFIANAFRTINNDRVRNLILDLRNNEGGSEHQQMELMSYLYDQPFKLYQNIYLSRLDFRPLKNIIVERDSASLVFNNDDEYMRKINDNLWINNYEYSENLQLRPVQKNVFKGQLYVLMNGGTFSSAADLIADLKRTSNAIFIGEESGGLYEGPTGGDNIVMQLPNSRIMVRISPNIQIGYMYQKHPIGRGVIPTHQITYGIKDIVDKRDLELDLAKELIHKSTH